MKLLILTQYSPPETGAPQNRLFELATRLKAKGVDVEILTAMPNYPKMEIFEAYKGKKYVGEEMEGLKSKGIVKRLMNYFSFVYTSYVRGKKLNAYNQFLQILIALGIVGLFLFLLPFYYSLQTNNSYIVLFIVITVFYMLTESILENQAGTIFLGLFFSLLNQKPLINE